MPGQAADSGIAHSPPPAGSLAGALIQDGKTNTEDDNDSVLSEEEMEWIEV